MVLAARGHNDRRTRRLRTGLLAVYLASGACSLAFQIVWARLVQQAVGSTVYAVSLVTAVFMGGLAVGSRWGGRIADRVASPLRAYALVEAATATIAALSFLLLPAAGNVYACVVAGAERTGTFVHALAMVVLPLILIGPATTAMGMSLPLLTRGLTRRAGNLGRDAGLVYVVNTGGAVLGAMVAGFVLVGAMGLTITWQLAVAVNAILAVVALFISRPRVPEAHGTADAAPTGHEDQPRGRGGEPDGLVPPAIDRRLLLAFFAASGTLSLGYELLWTRSLVTILGNSTYAFTSMLVVTLVGLVAGGAIMTARVDRVRRPLLVLGILEAGIGVTALVALPALVATLYTDGVQAFFFAERGGWLGSLALRAAAASSALLVPSLLNGATLPLMIRTYARSMARRGEDVGTAYAADAAGNVAGVVLSAFVLVPLAGVTRGLLVLGSLNVVLGLAYLLRRRVRWSAAAAAVALLAVAIVVPIGFQFPSDTYRPGDEVLFYEEGREATTRVYRKQDTGAYHMSVDGVFIGGSGDAARKELVLAHLHGAFLETPRTALTVGLGSGVLAAELAGYDSLDSIDVVEIAPSVARGALTVPEWERTRDDERVNLVVDDVMNHLAASDVRYDLIVSDGKSRPTARGNGLFFSSDYYAALGRKLRSGGVVLQWLSLHLAADDLRTVVRTFVASFEHVALFWLPDTDAFLIGSHEPIAQPRSTAPRPLRVLDRYGVDDAAAAEHLIVARNAALRGLAGTGPVSTLDRPVIEFYDPRAYARTPSSLVAANLETLAAASARTATTALLELLAQAYAGETPAAELDRRAAGLSSGPAPVAAAISRYFTVRAAGRLRAGDGEAALDYARRAVTAAKRTPGTPADASYYEGVALLQLGRPQEALTALARAVEALPGVPVHRVMLARTLVALGRTEEAIEHYRTVLEQMPSNVSALQSIGVFEASRGNDGRAVELLARAYELAPGHPGVIDSYAWALYRGGDTREARRIVRRGGDYADGRADFAERRTIILEGE